MVPFLGNVLEGEAEWFALAGRQRRCAEIDRIRIRAASLQTCSGASRLCDLSKRILENDMDCNVSDGLITGVGDRTIEISYGAPTKFSAALIFKSRILRLAAYGCGAALLSIVLGKQRG